MLNSTLLESLGLFQLVPPSLSQWRPLVVDGISFFLERLPGHHLEEIVASQLALPEGADAATRLVTLLSQCPTLHKLGQVLARNKRLPQDLRNQLQTLESMVPSTPMPEVLARLREELPPDLPIQLGRQPLAEGSVAVVVPFTYQENGERRDGVFKVLKPGIEERFAEEISVWLDLGAYLEKRSKELGLPALDFRGTLDSIRELLTNEIHLQVEQANMRAAHALYADEPRILIPRLLPWCTPKLTAMERIFGEKITEAELPSQRRRELASAMISELVGLPFWSKTQAAMVHADLHAGNLFVTKDGRLAVLDWSLALQLSKNDRTALVSIVLGGLTLDARRIRDAIASLGSMRPDDPVLVRAVERALDRVVLQGCFPGFDWVQEFLDTLSLETSAGFREDLVLFRKTWFSLSDVVGDLVGAHSPDPPLLKLGLARFIAELPARSLVPVDSAEFSTHLSNADLLRLSVSAWMLPARYWSRFWQQRISSAAAEGLRWAT